LSNDANAHWSIADLDQSEVDQILKAKKRESKGGPKVVNKTVGINGRKAPPRGAVYVWPAALERD
jgi:hypothetical protein